MSWIDAYYDLCRLHNIILSSCGCGENHVQKYYAQGHEIESYFDAYRKYWGLPKLMKTYTTRKAAFKNAKKRAESEKSQTLVLFSREHKDMVVRKNVGQKLSPDQVLVATCTEVTKTDPLRRQTKSYEVIEANHGLELK